MFRYATTQKKHPTAIRVPVRMIESGREDTADYLLLNRYKVVQRGTGVAVIAVGSLIPMAREAAKAYEQETGESITVVNPCFLTGTDDELLTGLLKDHDFVITLEDGVLDGGFGERIASFYGNTAMKVKNLGISKAFHSDFNAEALLEENGISVRNILALIDRFHLEGNQS